MAKKKDNGIVVFGAAFVDIKGYPYSQYIPTGRNSGFVVEVHGGVGRNIAEDIANVELRPTFVTVLDRRNISTEVADKLAKHRCNTEYITRTDDGLGTWLAVFDNSGDVVASISKRPDLMPMLGMLEEKGDEIFRYADSIAVEFDIEVPILKKVIELAQKHKKKVYAPVSNMSIAIERRDLLQHVDCLVCNRQEAELLFTEDFDEVAPEDMGEVLLEKVSAARMPAIVVTMGEHGAAYASLDGEHGHCPAPKVDVKDTTGAGDAFFSGVAIGLTYGKTLGEACEIGARISASVIITDENVCPRFLPAEFGLDVDKD
ncbi:MAG: bifunctional hydroxymethylpyrimidine kinase/phosphomethylpyrimidine kinase [Mogibacterium sp.]|nr:bifunctional hydroxymethylpyrimidine kinase/phosphomethylpyrimidine kinase [Mogibacterium sp.]